MKALLVSAILVISLMAVCFQRTLSASGSSAIGPMLAQQPQNAPNADAIRARAQRIKEMRALLNDPDATVRLETLNQMLKSDDAALHQLGIEAGFASADQNMRALALRRRLQPPADLVLELSPPETGDTKYVTEYLARWGSHVPLRIMAFDQATGQMKLAGGGSDESARLSGTLVLVVFKGCRGNLRLQDEGILAGPMSCRYGAVRAIARLI